MADLTDLQAAGSTKIVGSDSTGLEQTAVQSTSNGALHVNLRNNSGTEIGTTTVPVVIAGPGANGAAVSGFPVRIAASDGTNTRDLLSDSSGRAVIVGAGVAGTPAGGVLTIQGIAGGTAVPISVASLPLPSGAATEATLVKIPLAQGSTTSGQSGILMMGAVTTSAPSYTTGQTSPFSLTPAGAVRVDASASADPTYGTNNSTLPLKTQLVGGSDGTNIRPFLTDSAGRIVTSAITGFGADFSFGDITLAAVTQVAVRRTVYTEQTTNAQRSIVSSSANDAAAGTGARTVQITYFDQTGAGPFIESVTMNGITSVNTVNTNICYIENMTVTAVGSTGSNVGIISLKAAVAGGGVTVGSIGATDNQTIWAHHYVQTGKTCNITGFSLNHNGSTVGSGGLFVLKSKPLNNATAVEIQVSDFVRLYGQASTTVRNYGSPIIVAGPAKVTAYVSPETTTSTVYRAAFDFFQP